MGETADTACGRLSQAPLLYASPKGVLMLHHTVRPTESVGRGWRPLAEIFRRRRFPTAIAYHRQIVALPRVTVAALYWYRCRCASEFRLNSRWWLTVLVENDEINRPTSLFVSCNKRKSLEPGYAQNLVEDDIERELERLRAKQKVEYDIPDRLGRHVKFLIDINKTSDVL